MRQLRQPRRRQLQPVGPAQRTRVDETTRKVGGLAQGLQQRAAAGGQIGRSVEVADGVVGERQLKAGVWEGTGTEEFEHGVRRWVLHPRAARRGRASVVLRLRRRSSRSRLTTLHHFSKCRTL